MCLFHMMSNSVKDKTTTLSDNEMYIPVIKDEDNHSNDVDFDQSSDDYDNEG